MRRGIGTSAARAGAALLVVAASALSAPAGAQDTGTRLSAAEELFATGKTLMAEGDYLRACAKFDGSYKLDPAPGTLLNLALCHERVGRSASAWAEFKRVAAESRGRREDRAEIAAEHAGALFPRLARLAVSVEGSPSAETVSVDDVPLDASAWGTPIPIDLGPHSISARAPGKAPWVTSILVREEGGQIAVDVPALRDAAEATEGAGAKPAGEPAIPPAAPAAPPADGSSGPRTRRTVGYVLAGAGAASVVVGAVVGGLAIAARADATSTCPSSPCASAGAASSASDANRTAHHDATLANVTLGGGLVVLAAGLILALTARSAANVAAVHGAPGRGGGVASVAGGGGVTFVPLACGAAGACGLGGSW